MSAADLDAGDLVWVEFDPSFGHEQRGRRPALVLSRKSYNARSSCAIVCPVTGSKRPWPFHVRLPDGRAITGAIVVDQIKAIDSRRIVSPAVANVDSATLREVHRTLRAVLSYGTDAEPL